MEIIYKSNYDAKERELGLNRQGLIKRKAQALLLRVE
jgi:hypothetical protein